MPRKLTAEWIGTSSLLATVVGSGIMAERLAGGNVAIALLSNTIPTGAILVVLIMIFGPISSAHLNPAVTIARGFSDTFADIHPPRCRRFCRGAITCDQSCHVLFQVVTGRKGFTDASI